MKIFLSAGHNPKEVGACNEGWCEHPHACNWINTIATRLHDYGFETVIVPTGTLGEKVRFINKHAARGDLAVELHFNSNVNANGSETLYYPKSTNGKRFAEVVQSHLSKVFAPNRGAKEGYYEGGGAKARKLLYFLAKSNPVAIIIEPEFVFHKSKLDAKRVAGCEAIAYAIKDFINT